MWYTVESGKSTLRDEGELRRKLTHGNLREMFLLPPLDVVALGLSGDFSSLMKWAEATHVKALPFTFEDGRRIKFDLVPVNEDVVVGSVWYGASKTISATFNRTSDATDILALFYQPWLISYSHLGSAYSTISIRELVERIESC